MPRYALVIGISDYSPPFPRLSKTEGDAETLAETLTQYGDFQDVKLLKGKVTYQQLCQEIKTFGLRADGAEALLYFTGHGFPVSRGLGGVEVHLAASDCLVKLDSNKDIVSQEGGLSLSELNKFIQDTSLNSLAIFLDCCHSGSAIEDSWIISALSEIQKRNYFLLAACREFEQAWASKSSHHSVFSSALFQGLSQDNADKSNGEISCDSLFSFVKKALRGSGQEPISLAVGGHLKVVTYPCEQDIDKNMLLRHQDPTDISDVSRGTKIMELKMQAGEIFSQNIDHTKDCVASAEAIGIAWLQKHKSDRAKAQYEHIRMLVRTECIEAFNATKKDNEEFGEEMFDYVWNQLKTLYQIDENNLFGCRFEHLLGFAGILTEECKVWWSKTFDIPENL